MKDFLLFLMDLQLLLFSNNENEVSAENLVKNLNKYSFSDNELDDLYNIFYNSNQIAVNNYTTGKYILENLTIFSEEKKEYFLLSLESYHKRVEFSNSNQLESDKENLNNWLEKNYLNLLKFKHEKSFLSIAKLFISFCNITKRYDIMEKIRENIKGE